jgi:hypothetical protein
VQLRHDVGEVRQVCREGLGALAVAAAVAVVDEHPSVRHVELIVELGDGDGDLRAVAVTAVVITI